MLINFLTLSAVVVAVFPCSGLSVAGQRHGLVKRGVSLPEFGAHSDSSSNWQKPSTKEVEGHAKKRGTYVGGLVKRRSGSEINLNSPDIPINQPPYYALPITELQNVQDLTDNTEAGVVENQPQIQSSFKRSSNDFNRARKRDATLRRLRPVERNFTSNGKRQLSTEQRMLLHDIRMYQPYDALQPELSENDDAFEPHLEAHESDAVPSVQSSFKGNSYDQNHSQKRDVLMRSALPDSVVSGVGSYVKRDSIYVSDTVQHNIRKQNVPYGGQPIETLRVAAYDQSPDAELLDTNLNGIDDDQMNSPTELEFDNPDIKRNAMEGLYYQRPVQPASKGSAVVLSSKIGLNSLETGTNNNWELGQDRRLNARSLSMASTNFELSNKHQRIKKRREDASKCMLRRQKYLRYSNRLLELLKLELDNTQRRQSKLAKNAIQNNISKRKIKIKSTYSDSLKQDEKAAMFVKKRATTDVKRDAKSFPMEMLKFELDYKKERLKEKVKKQSLFTPDEQDAQPTDLHRPANWPTNSNVMQFQPAPYSTFNGGTSQPNFEGSIPSTGGQLRMVNPQRTMMPVNPTANLQHLGQNSAPNNFRYQHNVGNFLYNNANQARNNYAPFKTPFNQGVNNYQSERQYHPPVYGRANTFNSEPAPLLLPKTLFTRGAYSSPEGMSSGNNTGATKGDVMGVYDKPPQLIHQTATGGIPVQVQVIRSSDIKTESGGIPVQASSDTEQAEANSPTTQQQKDQLTTNQSNSLSTTANASTAQVERDQSSNSLTKSQSPNNQGRGNSTERANTQEKPSSQDDAYNQTLVQLSQAEAVYALESKEVSRTEQVAAYSENELKKIQGHIETIKEEIVRAQRDVVLAVKDTKQAEDLLATQDQKLKQDKTKVKVVVEDVAHTEQEAMIAEKRFQELDTTVSALKDELNQTRKVAETAAQMAAQAQAQLAHHNQLKEDAQIKVHTLHSQVTKILTDTISKSNYNSGRRKRRQSRRYLSRRKQRRT